MTRLPIMFFSVAAYAIFFATFLYLIAFVGDLPWVPVTVSGGGEAGPAGTAMAINLLLIALFGLQHSGMARRAFKRWWTGIVPPAAERSIYVLVSSITLIVLFAAWRPMPAVIWSVQGVAAALLWALFAAGWAILLLSTFLLNHFELFGLQQAWQNLRNRTAADPQFRTPFFYRLVRHPLYTGFLIAFWAAPVMTVSRMVFAAGMTAFVLVAIRLEERDLVAFFGDRYRDYRRQVGMLLPGLGRG
jgi:methanethiol S-methyltransferase